MANKKSITVSTAKMGMNKGKHISALKPEEYTHAKNSNFEDDNGNEFNIQNEHSNLLASTLKTGFRVVGIKKDLFSNKTYYFLTNPSENTSEIGYVENNSILPDLGDTITSCGNCEYKVDLAKPLEEQVQQETQEYKTLLNDSCNNCLSLDIDYPIKTIEIKNEKCGRVMYFTDNLNPPRYIQLDELDQYTYTGEELCGDTTNVVDTCVACDKMLMFKPTDIFDIVPSSIVLGGNLRMGSYEFIAAYSDESGNEISRYFSITNPISIFDRDNNIMGQKDIANETNYAIKLNVKGLDLKFTHYKVAVVQMTDINRATTYFVEGVHSTSDNTIIYTTDKDKERTTLSKLMVPSVRVKKWETLTASNGYLFGNGVTYEKRMNLQPVVSLMSLFLNWQTHMAKEDLYKDGIASSQYKGYYREEDYAFGIRFLLDGDYTANFPFIGRPLKTGEDQLLPTTNKDFLSVNKVSNSCVGTNIDKRWQYYDTAKDLGRSPLAEEVQTKTITEDIEKICYNEPHKQTYITLSGVSGTAKLSIDSADYTITFRTDLKTTAIDFVAVNATTIAANHNGLVASEYEGIIILDKQNWSNTNPSEYTTVSIINTTPNLNGVVKTNTYLDKKENGFFSISLDEGDRYIDLESFINNSMEECLSDSTLYPFCDLLDVSNYIEACEPVFDEQGQNNCTDPALVDEEVEIIDVIGEEAKKIEKQFPEEYSIISSPENCMIHERDFTTGDKARDTSFEAAYLFVGFDVKVLTKEIYKRRYSSKNETCNFAEDITEYNRKLGFVIGYYHNYYGSTEDVDKDTPEFTDSEIIETLQITDINATPYTYGNNKIIFTDKIHKGALWFTKEIKEEKNSFILNITPQNVPADQQEASVYYWGDDIPNVTNTTVRVTFFKDCSSSFIGQRSVFVDLSEGALYKVEYNNKTLKITDSSDSVVVEENIPSNKFYIAIDTPITEAYGADLAKRYRTLPTQGCFGVVTTDILYDRIEVTYSDILLSKKQTYTSSCDYDVPILGECKAYPNRYGEFGYTESTETYPDNKDLYDSSTLKISPDDIPTGFTDDISTTSFKEYFEENYTESAVDAEGNYVWKKDSEGNITDFRCRPIRHFRMPSNKTAPFMYDAKMAGFAESVIYPLGVTIDENVINSFLDIAVKNNLITQEQRDKVKGYEIIRGDRTADKSIISKGITFDMMKYRDEREEVLYANYPFNDIGSDRLNYKDADRYEYIKHPYDSEKNNNWTFHSPETDYNSIDPPSFMKLDGYMYGRTKGNFGEVRDHPEYVILGGELKGLASSLATTEVITETAVKSAMAFSNTDLEVGFSSTVIPGGIISSIVILVVEAFSAMAFKYARYKYEWLRTFKNLGAPKNFASYYSASGYYNYFKANEQKEQMMRYLNVAKNIKSGRLIVTDSIGGSSKEINHIDREKTLLLSTGADNSPNEEDYITYDESNYTRYDNSDLDINTASRTFASENNACKQGISKSIVRNTASMYVTLKEYLPSQYGEIGSIRWLTTGYTGQLDDPKAGDQGIFGGDVFITRHTLKRSMPMFVTTAMNTPPLSPFDYKRYSNIGKEPRFYLNYEKNNKDTSVGRPIPSLTSDYSFDCFSGNGGDYVDHPSKFYLYYHGVPNFLVESTINTWNRYAGPEPWNNFYPNVGDLMEWTQEKVNPIGRENSFLYNQTYSKNVTQTATFSLPINYDKEKYNCKTDMPNGTMYSEPDNSENRLVDPWLIFKPLNKYEFKTSYGAFVGMREIETAQILARFDNTAVVFNAVDTLVDDGTNPTAAALGTGGIFARRPRTLSNTDLGHMGSQTQSMVSCEYGHFFVDAKRGQVFKIENGGQGYEEISAYANGEPTGMKTWFKKHLPFKILKHFPDMDVDNPYNGTGITMGWDSLYKRVFITKKDYTIDGTFNQSDYCTNEGITYDISNDSIQPIIDQYTLDGYTYDGLQGCKLKFSKTTTVNPEPPKWALYIITPFNYDTETILIENTRQAFDNLAITYNFEKTSGSTIIGSSDYEWLRPINGPVPQPSTVNNINVVFNEGYSYYNGVYNRFQPVSDFITPAQETDFITGYNEYVSLYGQNPKQHNFIFPLIRNNSIVGNIMQAYAGYYGENITQTEANSIPVNSAMSANDREDLEYFLTNQNPYGIAGLQNYGWHVNPTLNDTTTPIVTVQELEDYLDSIIDFTYTPEPSTTTEEITVDAPVADLSTKLKEISWTISYNLKSSKWGSFFDFKPNYYVSHNGYFQTGINSNDTTNGVWSHLLTNKSYGVFYGKRYPWEIEIPVQNKNISKYLETITYDLDVRRYHNDYDYAENKYLGFDEAVIWNQGNNSGKIKLEVQKTTAQISKYPKTSNNEQTILQTSQDSNFTFNYFYNRVKNDRAGLPLFFRDENEIDKKLNEQAISFYGKRTLERLKGDTFLINLKSNESQHKKIFKIAKIKENLYNK